MHRLLALSLGVLLASASLPAFADEEGDRAQARAHFQKGQAAYALGRYEEAAKEYEDAFSFKQDPALLYDAAQAHRLNGNKERALLLYRNYLRIFGGKASNRAEVEKQIATLKDAIDSEKRARAEGGQPIPPKDAGTHETTGTRGGSTPTRTASSSGTPSRTPSTTSATADADEQPAATVTPTTQPEPTPAPPLEQHAAPVAAVTPPASEPPPPAAKRSRLPLFIGLGAAAVVVIAGAAVGIGVAASQPIDPSPTFGRGALQ